MLVAPVKRRDPQIVCFGLFPLIYHLDKHVKHVNIKTRRVTFAAMMDRNHQNSKDSR